MFSPLFVCLSVSNFVQKLPNRFAWNYQWTLAISQWTNDKILVAIQIRKVVNGHKSAAHTDLPDGGWGKTCLGRGMHCPRASSCKGTPSHSPSRTNDAGADYNLLSTSSQVMALLSPKPVVTFQVQSVTDASQYQFILLGEQRHMCVNVCLGSLHDSEAVSNWTCDGTHHLLVYTNIHLIRHFICNF